MLLDIKNFFYQKYYRDLSAISFASLIVPLLNAIIVIPLFIVNWGVDKYGEWIILLALVGFTGFFTIPIHASYGNEVANNRESKVFLEKSFIHYFLLMLIVCGLILSAYIIIFYVFFENYEIRYIENKNIIYFLLVITGIIDSFFSLLLGGLRFFSQYKKSLTIEFVLSLSKISLIILLLFLQMDPIYLCLGNLVISFVMILYILIYCRYIVPSFNYRLFNILHLKESIQKGSYRLLYGLGFNTKLNIEILILGSLLKPSYLVLYTTTLTLVNIAQTLQDRFSRIFIDELSVLYSQKKYAFLKKKYNFFCIFSLFLIFCLAVPLFFFGEWIFTYWTRQRIFFDNVFFILILFSAILQCIGNAKVVILSTLNEVKIISLLQLFATLSSLIATYILTFYFGIHGSAFALISFYAVMLFCIFYSVEIFFSKITKKY
jgi:O-antigen/teichoic acid export membrane protein|tara:strand:- start:1048 stop:2346 length:1299 start_codon:yes stop_codon:yes gene_type:complete